MLKESPNLANTPKVEKPRKTLDEIYRQELAPLARIFQLPDETEEECEDRVLKSPGEIVERSQNIENRMTAGPEETLQETKALLLQESRQIISDYGKKKDKKALIAEERELLKKARIVLLTAGDRSDWDKYSRKYILEVDANAFISYYLDAEKSSWRNDQEDLRLTSAEVSGLIKGGLGPILSEIDSYKYGDLIKETPDELLQLLAKKNDSHLVNKAIEKCPAPEGYSAETIKVLNKTDQGHLILKNIPRFEKTLKPEDIKELIESYDPEYPYHLNDLLGYIKKLNWNRAVKTDLIDFTFKHNNVVDKGFKEALGDDAAAQYNKIDEGIKKIVMPGDGWERIPPKELTAEAITELKKYISDGYITFFHQYYDYIPYFAENDYEWLRDQLIKNNQENLLISGRGDCGLKLADQKIYAAKLIAQDKTLILKKLIEKGGTAESLLSPENYNKMLDNGDVLPLKFLSGRLSEESFAKIMAKKPRCLEGSELFENINCFDFKDTRRFGDYKNYQEFINFIEEKFGLKNDLYLDLKLEMSGLSREELIAYQEELARKADILKARLDSLYPNIPEKSTLINTFSSEFGFKMFAKTEAELEVFLETLAALPNQFRFKRENQPLLLGAAEAIKDFTPEEKKKVEKKLEKMLEIFDPESGKNLFNRYLNRLGNKELGQEIIDLADIAPVIPKYSLFYKTLSPEEKIFFQELFPWSEALANLPSDPESIKAQEKYLISLLRENKKIADPDEAADGKLLVEYSNRFQPNNLPKFFSLFAAIKRGADGQGGNQGNAGLSPEIIKTLNDDFKITVGGGENIDSILDRLQAVYQKVFIQNNDLIRRQFGNSLHFSDGNGYLFEHLKILALNGGLAGEDNDLIINFFKKYVNEKEDRRNSEKSQLLFQELKIPLDRKNWGANLDAYIEIIEEVYNQAPQNLQQEIINLFSGDYRDECFKNMRAEWLEFLDGGNTNLSLRLTTLAETIKNAGGAGSLKYIEALGDLIAKVDNSNSNPKTADRTKAEIKEVLAQAETRFNKDKWSQDDRAKFYNLSKDIIEAAPSLFAAFAPVFEQLSGKDVKLMLKDILPLYQVELITIQQIAGQAGEISYNPRDLVPIRRALNDLAAKLKQAPEDKDSVFIEEKNRLTAAMQSGFKDRFGLIKVPVEFKKDELRSIQNCIRYVGNINNRTEERETLIAFYLGLELNGDWEKFRQGQNIDAEKYLTPAKADIIKEILAKKKTNSLPLEIIGLKAAESEKFQQILQEEISGSMAGNLATVDIKLGNIRRNMQELIDPDIYENKTDKELVKLLTENGKSVGTVLSKIYRNIILSEPEKELREKLAAIFAVPSWTGETVKEIQDKIQPFGLITGLINKLEEEKVGANIDGLQKSLEPSEKIITIFNRLNEDFKPASGALALSRDLEYLEELAVKNDAKLSPEEKEDIKNYLNPIREKMVALEATFQKTKEYFDKVKKSMHLVTNELMKDRLAEIEKIVYSEGGEAMIVSRLTKDLNLIIENMRQCLGCLKKEANNDTNLAFGDYNKFFLISQKGKETGSVADEIVFFVPLKNDANRPEMSFIMDRVYGSKSSDILLAHVLAVYKKYAALKKEFKDSNISMTISDATLASVGLSPELFQEKIQEKISALKSIEYVRNMVANVPESSLGDNYLEFSSNNESARKNGERTFSGVVIR